MLFPSYAFCNDTMLYGRWFEYVGNTRYKHPLEFILNNNCIEARDDKSSNKYLLQKTNKDIFEFASELGVKIKIIRIDDLLLLFNDKNKSPILLSKEPDKIITKINNDIKGIWTSSTDDFGSCSYLFKEDQLTINCYDNELITYREDICIALDKICYIDPPVLFCIESISDKWAVLSIITPTSRNNKVIVLERQLP